MKIKNVIAKKKTITPKELNAVLTKELNAFLKGKVTNTHVRTVVHASNAIMRTIYK